MPGFKPRHLLALVDLSPASSLVLCWTRLFAQAFASEVEVLHAVVPPQFVFEGQEQVQTELSKTELHAAVGRLAQENLGNKVPCRIVVEEGHPVQVVMAYLQRHTPDLIVMGSHGHDGMARVMLGSVAENVVRVARCPMLIVRGAEPAESRLNQILCPIALSRTPADCTQVAGILATLLGAKLEVATVVQESEPSDGIEQVLRARVSDGLRRACAVTEAVLRGDAAEQIVERSRAAGADLVVLGIEHRPFLEFTTLGRTTERVMRYSPCSVLLVPRSA